MVELCLQLLRAHGGGVDEIEDGLHDWFAFASEGFAEVFFVGHGDTSPLPLKARDQVPARVAQMFELVNLIDNKEEVEVFGQFVRNTTVATDDGAETVRQLTGSLTGGATETEALNGDHANVVEASA